MNRRVSVGAALFFCLLAATFVTAVLVVRARTPNLVLEVTDPPASDPASLRPGGPGPREVPITFFVRESDDHALVAIVDSHENIVRTLDPDTPLTKRDPETYVWDGRTDSGGAAIPGRYRLLVELPGEDREMIWPRRITVLEPSGSP